MKKFLVCIAALLCAAALCQGQELPQLPNDPATRVGKLDNGLTYYIRHNEQPAQRAEFYLATNVGAIQETPDQDGLAHFLEHMCFNGTKNFPGKGILNWLESIGASFGANVNASTGIEQTVYLLNNIPLIRPTVVDTCLLIMHDYSHFVLCEPEEIDAERGVIIEEKRTRNTGDWRNNEHMFGTLFQGCKYAESLSMLIGSEENLKTFKPESLTNFYHTWYNPWNQALIVVGDINVDEVEAKIQSTFADIPAPENYQQKEVIKVPDNKEPIVGIFTDPELTRSTCEITWKSDARPEVFNSTTVGLMTDLLEDIASMILNERFEELSTKADCPFVGAGAGIQKVVETLEAVVGQAVSKDGKALDSFESLYTEFERMRRYGFTDAEIDRAKTELLSQYETKAKKADTRKNSEFVYPLIDNFFDNKAYMDPATAYQYVQAILPQLAPAMINQACQAMITSENIVVRFSAPQREGVVVPTADEFKAVIAKVLSSEIAAPAGEDIPDSFLDPAALKGSKVKKTEKGLYGSTVITLKNGLKAILYPTDVEKDKISINVLKKGGRGLLSDEEVFSFEDNIWSLYNNCTGISSFSATTVTKMLSGKQLHISPFIARTTHGVSGTSTVKDVETAMQMVYLYFADPRFDQDEYNQGMAQISAILPNLINQPNYKLQQHMYDKAYNSPRAFFISPEIVEKASLQTIETGYRRLFADAAGATAIIAGDFNVDEMIPLVEKYLGSLPKGKKASNWKDCGDGIVDGTVIDDFRVKMETPKVTVYQILKVNGPATKEKETCYDAVSYILDMVYTATLREEEGGTYGASTFTRSYDEPYNQTVFFIAFDTNEQQADRLCELSIEGFRKLAEEGPTDEQFDKALKNAQKLLPEQRLRVSYWDKVFQDRVLYGLDADAEAEAAIKALTPEKVKAAAAEILNSGNFVKLVMRPQAAE